MILIAPFEKCETLLAGTVFKITPISGGFSLGSCEQFSFYLAPPVRGLPVDVELEVLVLVHEAAARLEDGEVGGVLLREQVRVVAVRQLRLHLDRLQANLQNKSKRNVIQYLQSQKPLSHFMGVMAPSFDAHQNGFFKRRKVDSNSDKDGDPKGLKIL